MDEGEAAAAEPAAEEAAEGSAEPEPDPEPAEAGAHEEQQEAVLEETAAVASESSATPTDGWTAYKDTCEYKIDDQGCLTLRPLGGAASAELDRLYFSHRTDFTSFKTEGAIAFTGTGKSNGLSLAFMECSKLKTADLSGLVIDGAVDCGGLFYGCSSLTSAKLPEALRVSDASSMFYGCSKLASADLSGLVTDEAVDASGLFSYCSSLASVKLPATLKVSDASSMFCDCPKLPSADLSGLETPEAVDCGYMFYNCSSLTSVKLPATLRVSSLGSSAGSNGGMFYGCSKLASADLSGLVTDEAVYASGLFSYCSSLASVKLPETLRVSDASSMFYNCSKLASADLSGLETPEAVDCGYMFYDCSSLASVKLPATLKVSDASSMFSGCSKLASVDLSGLVTDEAVSASGMFYDCSSLASVKLPAALRASSLSHDGAGGMFSGCSKLASVDLSGLVTDEAVSASGLFSGCSSLASVKLPATLKVSHASSMFSGCSKLASVDLSGLVTDEAVSASGMFSGCSSLASVKLPATLKVSSLGAKIVDIGNGGSLNYGGRGMFEDCVSLVNVDISGIVTPDSVDAGDLFNGCASLASIKVPDSLKVSCACGMFEDCSKLKTADLSGLVTDGAVYASRMFSDCLLLESVTMPETLRVSSASSMFSSCSSLKSIDTTGLDTSAATSLSSMFSSCAALASLDLSGFDTSSVTDMRYMFSGCSKLAFLDVSGFNTSSVTDMRYMFSGCSKLAFLDVSGFDTSKVTDFCGMFQSCEKLESLDLSSFDTSNALDIGYMFGGSFPTTIKLGDKFTFNGAYSERKLDFPTVNSWPSIYTGKWISSADGKVYAANEIPNNVAATYTAQKAVTAQLFTVDTADEVCSGAPITKKVTSEKLVEGRDYEVVYANNTAPGKATIAINGVGDLGGSVEYNFDIYPANYTWSTSDGAQDISTTINYKAKVEWKSSNDSVVSIGEASTSTTELGPIVSQKCSVKVTPKAVGTAFVYAYANGMQVAKVAVQVVAGAGKSIAGAQIGGVPASCTYNGEKVEPKVTVTLDGKRLTEGADYTVSYGANTDAGTGSVTVTGTGGYTGSASMSFTIKQAGISGAKVSAADQAWTGKALTPAPTVVWNGRTLAENTDYTVSYANNVNAGTATVTVAGKGNFAGTASGTFKITKPEPGKTDISGAEVGVNGGPFTYTGSAKVPGVTVRLGGKTLSAGTDYDVRYANNLNAGTATVTVTGKGNYTGAATGSFKIAAIDASKASVKAADQAWTGKPLTPAPTVTLNGKTLAAGTDYTAAYANNVNAGTATVTVTFKGNYSGTAKGTFKITKKDSGSDQPAASKVTMYRLYNKYTGEHFYTADAEEKDHLVKVGWNDEGVGWTAPSKSSTPVYRLYNKYVPGGDHHYTTNKKERDDCVKAGWTYEGVGWYSDDAKGTPLYRQYNPYAKTGTHNYTVDKDENDHLVSLGWREEGISWYGVK